jgi:transcriptional regulator with XRE-family HTH domain
MDKKMEITDRFQTKNRDNVIAIGQRIKELRKYLRISQREMAESFHMSSSYLSEIESGKGKPGPEFFLKLSDDYNVRIEYLFHGTGEMFYGTERTIDSEEFDFNENVDTIGKMVWLMEHSPFFKSTILGFASKFLLDNERILRKSIERDRMKKGGKTGP